MSDNRRIYRGIITDLVFMSDGPEFWIKLDKESHEDIVFGDEKHFEGKKVEVHVKE